MNTQRTLRAAILALGLTALVSAPAVAQYRYYDRDESAYSFSLNFNSAPHWNRVAGTRVMVMRERPGYDVFRYGSDYYAYRQGRWYMAPDWRSEFRLIDASSVPYEFRRVPRRHWRSYPHWRDYDYDNSNYDRGYDRERGWDHDHNYHH
jgi:hypothetical protein